MGKIIENYSLMEELGEGVYGKVFRAVHMKTKQQVAIKVIKADRFKQIPKLEECTVNEINILSTIQNCPYIIRYIDMLKTTNNFYFVYEYCNGGTLDRQMQKDGPFPQRKALLYFKQMIQAFKVLSKSNIMHRDLKPDNILMHNGMIKLGDFGFCKSLQDSAEMTNTMLGSPIYMAPQVIKGQTYSLRADIWSLGVVLFQMVFGKCPFQSKSIAKLIKLLDEQDLVIPETPKISQTLKELLRKMLVKDHKQRIDWPQIFQFTITQNGDILPKNKFQQNNEFQPRSSLRGPGGYGSNSINNTSSYYGSNGSNGSNNNSSNLKQSQNTSTSLMNGNSPKLMKQSESNHQEINSLMKKKSPIKSQTILPMVNDMKNQPSFFKNELLYSKNDRPGRLDMLIKNHGKLVTINQIALDCIKTERQKTGSLAISYVLFKSLEREMNMISDGLKKQPMQARVDDFRLSIDKQIESLRVILSSFRQCIADQNCLSILGNLDEPNKMRVMKFYYQNNKLDTQEEIILAAQIVDYLDEGMLIRRESYQKMGKEALLKQVKGKFLKYL